MSPSMQSVVLTELGIAVFDGPECLKTFPFTDATTQYMAVKSGEAELDELVKHAESLNTGVQVNDGALLEALRSRSIEAQLADAQEIARIQSDKPALLVEAGFAKDHEDAVSKLREFAIGLSSSKVAEISQSPDMHIIQAIRTIDETDKTINAYNSRLREWYGLHFPELENVIDSIPVYARIVSLGRRSEISAQALGSLGIDDSSTQMVSLLAPTSRGGDITDQNLAMVSKVAEVITRLTSQRASLEEHLEVQMNDTAPNLTVILGVLIGARIISRAGSLTKLARMPASTIQVLGAEKALFRAIKTGARPPKHGMIFQHKLVHAAPRWQRGKMARAIASKAAIAARVDMYGGTLNRTLLEKLNVRVGEIGSESEPKRPERPVQRSSRPRNDYSDKRGHKKAGKRRFDKRSGKVRTS